MISCSGRNGVCCFGWLSGRFRSPDPLCPVVDIEVIGAEEPNQSDVELAGDLNREAGWRSHSSNHRDASHERLLQQFKAGATGEHQNAIAQRQSVLEQCSANQLVKRIVTAHIFPDSLYYALSSEQGRCM